MIVNTKISIIIPNWNGAKLLQKNLSSVIMASNSSEIILVDDCSDDESIQILNDFLPKITVIQKKRHEGYSRCINEGVNKSHGEIVILLNTDVSPEKNFLKYLTPHFTNKQVFAVACLDRSYEKGDVVSRGRGLAFWRNGFYIHRRGEITKTDTSWVSGGSGAFRKRIWFQLGGMDPIYNPFYWEDIDLSYRALKAGYVLIFEPRSVVSHYHEEGIIKQNYTRLKISQIAYRNQFIFIWKNITDLSLVLDHIFWLPLRLIQTLAHGDTSMIVGFLMACARLPLIIFYRLQTKTMYTKTDRSILFGE